MAGWEGDEVDWLRQQWRSVVLGDPSVLSPGALALRAELLEATGFARLRRVADAAARVASVGYACCCPRETPCERCTDRRELRAALDALEVE